MLTINLKQAALVVGLTVLAFVGGTFYGQAGIGRYRIENGLMVDTKSGKARPVSETIVATSKPSFDWSKYPTVNK